MISILTTGKLTASPNLLTTKAGKPYIRCKLACHDGEQNILVSVTAFAAEAVEMLRKLDKGDAVAIAGTGKPSSWLGKDGQPVAGMDVLADSAMTTYAAGKKRDKFRQVSGQDRQVKPKQSTARQNADSGELMDDLPWD